MPPKGSRRIYFDDGTYEYVMPREPYVKALSMARPLRSADCDFGQDVSFDISDEELRAQALGGKPVAATVAQAQAPPVPRAEAEAASTDAVDGDDEEDSSSEEGHVMPFCCPRCKLLCALTQRIVIVDEPDDHEKK